MSQSIFRMLVVLMVLISVFGCSNNSQGPVGEHLISEDDNGDGIPEVKSLFQKVLENGVPEIPLRQAFDYFDQHKHRISNKKYMTIIDFSQHSGNKRFYLIDLKTGAVDKLLTSHGKGSDPDHDGMATKFSNVSGSHMTSLGFMLTAERYFGKHGLSLRLDGQESINSNARPRAIVIHGASYVDPDRPIMGRSFGCPAVENRLIVSLVKKIEGKSLLYAYYTGL